MQIQEAVKGRVGNSFPGLFFFFFFLYQLPRVQSVHKAEGQLAEEAMCWAMEVPVALSSSLNR